jgi:translation elongation factor EF-1beta
VGDINDRIHFNELKKMIKEVLYKDYTINIKTELEEAGFCDCEGFFTLKGYKLLDCDTGEIKGGRKLY